MILKKKLFGVYVMNKLDIEPYWVNAAKWYINNRGISSINDFHNWLRNQGVINLPRKELTLYIEFSSIYELVLFQIKWS